VTAWPTGRAANRGASLDVTRRAWGPPRRAVGISLEVGIRCRAEWTALHAGDGWPIPGVDPRALGPDDYASPEKRLFFMMACTPQLPSTTCVMP
jgi:hypothetical protein